MLLPVASVAIPEATSLENRIWTFIQASIGPCRGSPLRASGYPWSAGYTTPQNDACNLLPLEDQHSQYLTTFKRGISNISGYEDYFLAGGACCNPSRQHATPGEGGWQLDEALLLRGRGLVDGENLAPSSMSCSLNSLNGVIYGIIAGVL